MIKMERILNVMNKKMLSVILPVYNGENYLQDMLHSIDEQTYENYELIIVNDGSTDSSREICEEWKQRNAHIKIFDKENGGTSSARNLALEFAQGKYVLFLDQDDTIDQCMFHELVSCMENEKVDMLISSKKFIVEKEKGKVNVQEYTFDEQTIATMEQKERLLFNIERRNEISTIWNCIYRLDIIQQKKIRFSEYLKHGGEDGLFNYEFIIKAGVVKLISKKYYNYYLRYGFSTVTKYNGDVIRDKLYAYEEMTKISTGILDEKKMENYIQYDKLRMVKTIYQHFSYYQKGGIKSKIDMLRNICQQLHMNQNYTKICTKNSLYDRYVSFISAQIKEERYLTMVVFFEILMRIGR